jgi:choline-sulfatase
MHFFGPDQRHGFETRPIAEFGAGYPGSPKKGGPSFKRYGSAALGQSRECVETAGYGRTAYQWEDERITEAACLYLREKGREAAGRPSGGRPSSGRPIVGRPFAAVVGYTLPHCPYIAPRELFERYYDAVDIPPQGGNPPPTIERFRRHREILDLPEERIRTARAAYFGLCEHADSLVGRLLNALEEEGLSENTLVLYCSDHGDMAGEHGCWWKSNYYEGSAAVPLIISLPGVLPSGVTSAGLCNLMDLGPTLLDFAGAGPMDAVDGTSLWSALTGEASWEVNAETLSEFVEVKYTGATVYPSRMIRRDPWKLWLYADEEELPPALFNLESDPKEENDLGQDSFHASLRRELLERLREGWDPDWVRKESMETSRFFRTQVEWARTVRPPSPEALRGVPEDLEEGIVLL